MNNTNNISARMSYDNARRVLYDAWIGSFQNDSQACMNWVNSRKLSQSEIRLEVELTTTSTSFVFAVTPNQQNTTGVIFNTERRLDLQNSLVCSEYAILIGQPSSRTDTTWRPRTYPNTQDFAAADVTALGSTFYGHGSFGMKVNNDVIIPYRGLWNHLYIPQTQQTAALGAGSPQDQVRGSEDSTITDEPNILLIGSKNYVPEITLPTALASAAAFQRAILLMRGVLAQNSTVIN